MTRACGCPLVVTVTIFELSALGRYVTMGSASSGGAAAGTAMMMAVSSSDSTHVFAMSMLLVAPWVCESTARDDTSSQAGRRHGAERHADASAFPYEQEFAIIF